MLAKGMFCHVSQLVQNTETIVGEDGGEVTPHKVIILVPMLII